jgi:hypothetical protein
LRLRSLLYASLVIGLMPLLVQADIYTLVTGTPGDGVISPATGPSPNLGSVLLNFSNLSTNANCQADVLADCPTFNPTTYSNSNLGVTISSLDANLAVYPFSVQRGPNELFDNTPDGSSNVLISTGIGTTAIGVGIADSDDLTLYGNPSAPVNITLKALGSGGVVLDSWIVTTPEINPNTAGNGYWVVEDNTDAIYGLEISTPATDEGGLAIADVQAVLPEPSYTFLLVICGAAMVGFARLRNARLRNKA